MGLGFELEGLYLMGLHCQGIEGRVGEWVGWVVRLEHCFYASPARLYGTFRLQLLRATYNSALQVCNTIISSANLLWKHFSSHKLTFIGRDRIEKRQNAFPREHLFFKNTLIKELNEEPLGLYIKGSFLSNALCTTQNKTYTDCIRLLLI